MLAVKRSACVEPWVMYTTHTLQSMDKSNAAHPGEMLAEIQTEYQ